MNDKEWKLTKAGEEQVEYFIKECEAKRKEILDAGKTRLTKRIFQQRKIF